MKRTKPRFERPDAPAADRPKPGVTLPPILLEGDEPAPAPLVDPAQRFAPRPAASSPASAIEPRELPTAYGTGRLILVARDPRCLYAHWDLTPEQQRTFNHLSAHQHLLVRVHREGGEGTVISQVHVHPESRHWFIHIDPIPCRYVAELGYHLPGGPWKTIAASDAAESLLPGSPAEQEVRFATLNPPSSLSAAEPPPSAALRPLDKAEQQPPWVPPTHPIGPSPLPIELGGPTPPPALREVMPFIEQSLPLSVSGSELAVPQVWTPAQQQALAKLVTVGGQRQNEMESPLESQLPQGVLQGPSAVSSIQHAQGQPGFGPGAQPISSAGLAAVPWPSRAGFWFNVNAELVVYGATEPGAQVSIGGTPIRLRPDGTFSYRFALPDGTYQLPISAASADGDVRSAELVFYRGTVYSGQVGAAPQDPGMPTPGAQNVR